MGETPVVAARRRAPVAKRAATRTVAVLTASAARGRGGSGSRALGLFGRDRLDRGDDVLQLGDLTQRAPGRQALVFGHGQDERALMRLEALEEGIELVGHTRAVALSGRANKLVIGTSMLQIWMIAADQSLIRSLSCCVRDRSFIEDRRSRSDHRQKAS
jgi:hypothetical protein